MKELKLWLASAFICCALLGQSPLDRQTLNTADSSAAFSFFNVTLQNGHALLKWAAPFVRPDDFFRIEKSVDGQHFEMLSAIDATVGTDSVFSIVDNSTGSGNVFYRIRISGREGKEVCSKTVSMTCTPAADFKFYPNPVDKLLIIRSQTPLTIQVVDAYGVVWFNQDIDAGMQIVNVSSLQKGNYILKATDKSTNTVVSEQLVKNN